MMDDPRVTQTGDTTYTGFAVTVPGVDQIEVVATYCDDPDEQAKADQRAYDLALQIRELLT